MQKDLLFAENARERAAYRLIVPFSALLPILTDAVFVGFSNNNS